MRISDWSSDVCSSDLAKRASSDARLTPPEALDMMLSMLSFMRFGSRFTRRQKRLRGLQFGLDLRLFISIIAPRKFGAQLLDLLLDGHLNLLDHAKDYVRDRGGDGRVKDREADAQRRWGCRDCRLWSGAKRSGTGGKIRSGKHS